MKKLCFIIFVLTFLVLSCKKTKTSFDVSNVNEYQNDWLKEEITEKIPDEQKAPEKQYRFVNTLDGVNIRDTPNGNRIAKLNCNEKVEILEKGEYAEIDDYHNYWFKVSTENGIEGYVYGAYLSDSLEKAAEFRCEEQLQQGWEWFIDYEKYFRENMNVNIETNPEHIIYDEGLYNISMCGENHTYFLFYPTCNRETGKSGSFLYSADINYYNNADYCYPDFLPFKLGDNIEKIYALFGKPNYDRNTDTNWWCDYRGVAMHIETDADIVTGITLTKWGW